MGQKTMNGGSKRQGNAWNGGRAEKRKGKVAMRGNATIRRTEKMG